MGSWKIIEPEATVNHVVNPSFELSVTVGWTFGQGGAGGSANLSETWARFGVYSCRLRADDSGTVYNRCDAFSLADGAALTATAWATGLAQTARLLIYDVTTGETRATDNETLTGAGTWHKLETSWTNTTGGAVNIQIYIYNLVGNSTADIWYDAVQAEKKDHSTTFCDGEQDGCEWDGAKHNSTSRRSASWRGGGRVRDLKDDLRFAVTRATGVGAAAIKLSRQPYATVPGSRLTGVNRPERTFTLVGNIIPTNSISTQSIRDDLERILLPDAYPEHNGRAQPVRLRYTGAATDKEISAHYEGGLEADWTIKEIYNFESAPIRFFSEDPFWYEIGESAQVLDTQNSGVMRHAAAYLKDEGRWDLLNVNNAPTTFTRMNRVRRMSNGKVWFVGKFTGWNGTGGMDMAAIFDLPTRQWEMAGGSGAFHDSVTDVLEAANGTVYACGEFGTADGSDVTHVAKLVGSNWVTLGSPGDHTSVISMAFASNSDLYIAGEFIDFAGVSGADGVARWDGSWHKVGNTHLGSGSANPQGISLDAENHPYILGNQMNFCGTAGLNYAAWYNGTTWAAFGGGGFNTGGRPLQFDPNGKLYIGGAFITPGTYVVVYNGNSFEQLGDGLSEQAYDVRRGPDGIWYFAGKLANTGYKWDGAEFARLPLTISVTPTSYFASIDLGPADPVLDGQYDIWLATTDDGTAYFAGTATATNAGNAQAFPYLKVKREGGSSAKLLSLRNQTTGKEIAFDYDLQDGEELTIDLRPHRRNIVSTHRGQQWSAAKRGSSIGPWFLQRGANDILAYVEEGGGPTVTANLIWRDTFAGFDG